MSTAVVSKAIEFDAGHRVPEHWSKCRNPHGHRYKVEVVVEGEIPADGMVVDFGVLKELMVELIHDRCDHAMLVGCDDIELLDALAGHSWRVVVLEDVPTAENLAHEFARELGTPLGNEGLVLRCVRVWETPTCMAEVVP